ncbi:hypothetical protein GCM10022630_39640 [Thermobifida alba]
MLRGLQQVRGGVHPAARGLLVEAGDAGPGEQQEAFGAVVLDQVVQVASEDGEAASGPAYRVTGPAYRVTRSSSTRGRLPGSCGCAGVRGRGGPGPGKELPRPARSRPVARAP